MPRDPLTWLASSHSKKEEAWKSWLIIVALQYVFLLLAINQFYERRLCSTVLLTVAALYTELVIAAVFKKMGNKHITNYVANNYSWMSRLSQEVLNPTVDKIYHGLEQSAVQLSGKAKKFS